jgi:PhnB protein
MADRAKPIPDGYHAVTPYLTVRGAARLIRFLAEAFDGKESLRHAMPDGRIVHAEVRIRDALVMIGETPGPEDAQPASLFLYVEDADATYRRALKAGGVSVAEPETKFYGERMGGIADPSGNTWWISTHVEDVTPEEVARRTAALGHP